MPRGGGRGGGGGGGRGGGAGGAEGGGRGRKKNHKGQRRMFTDEESLREQTVKDEKAKAWRRQCGIESSDEEEDKDAGAKNRDLPPSGSSEESSSEDEDVRPCGVSHLIEVSNPNRQAGKTTKKLSELGDTGSAVLSRREREELEKQDARRKYAALHAEGKTDEAQADLARLAIIRKQREEAAKKRDEETKALKEKEGAKGQS